MTGFTKVLEALKSAEVDEASRNRAIGNTAIASFLAACESGFVIEFDDALKLITAICESASFDTGAGALFDWNPLKAEISNMEIAQIQFDETCRAADDSRDYAWEADAASINRENAMVAA